MSLFGLARLSSNKLTILATNGPWAIKEPFRLLKFTSSFSNECHRLDSAYHGRANTKLFSMLHDVRSKSRSSDSTVDHEEIAKFDRAASGWWDRVYGSENAALHTMNSLRVPLIRNALVEQQAVQLGPSVATAPHAARPLNGLTILDVGCGGGILSEPLARLGAKVTGIDASPELISVATEHAELDSDARSRLSYVCSSVEEFARQSITEQFDGVVASEIVEHVNDVDSFVSTCCSLVKPGGSLFITTMNKTSCSYVATILMAEQLLGLVPRGTHDWNKYISPEDLENIIHRNKLTVRLVHGMTLNPVTLHWSWISSSSVNFALHAVKLNSSPGTTVDNKQNSTNTI